MEDYSTTIKKVIKKYSNIEMNNYDINLLDEETGLDEIVMLYIVDELDKMYDGIVSQIIAESDYHVLTINNMTESITERLRHEHPKEMSKGEKGNENIK